MSELIVFRGDKVFFELYSKLKTNENTCKSANELAEIEWMDRVELAFGFRQRKYVDFTSFCQVYWRFTVKTIRHSHPQIQTKQYSLFE